MKSELKSSSYPTMELLLIILMKNCFKHPISLLTNCFIFCLAEYVLPLRIASFSVWLNMFCFLNFLNPSVERRQILSQV